MLPSFNACLCSLTLSTIEFCDITALFGVFSETNDKISLLGARWITDCNFRFLHKPSFAIIDCPWFPQDLEKKPEKSLKGPSKVLIFVKLKKKKFFEKIYLYQEKVNLLEDLNVSTFLITCVVNHIF